MTTRETLTAGDGAESAEEMDRQTRDREAAADAAVTYLTDTDPLYHGPRPQPSATGNVAPSAPSDVLIAQLHGDNMERHRPAQTESLPATVEQAIKHYGDRCHQCGLAGFPSDPDAPRHALRAAIAAALAEARSYATTISRETMDSLSATVRHQLRTIDDERAAREAAEARVRELEAALRRIVAGGDGDPYGIAEEVLAARAAGGADA